MPWFRRHTVELPHIRVCVSFSGLILIIRWREAPTSEFSFMTFTFTFSLSLSHTVELLHIRVCVSFSGWFWLSGEERHRPANLLLWLSATFEWIGREISHSCNCTRHGIKSGHLRWKKYIWEFSIKVGGNCSKSSHYMNDYMNYYKWCFTSFWMKRNTLAEACKLANLWRKLSLPG